MNNEIAILVVDDERSIRNRCVKLLSREGYKVQGADNGFSALAMMTGSHFDIALIDIKMPRMDGIKLTKKIGKVRPATKIVVMTGYPTHQTTCEAGRLKVAAYLTKPFNKDELLNVIREISSRNRNMNCAC
jgi:DNA-binding NtrC family response regulator